MQKKTETIDAAREFVNQVYQKFKDKTNIFLFSGELGAGKTLYISYILKKNYNIKDVASPTYTIVNTYKVGEEEKLHADLYRLESEEEIFESGIPDLIKQKFEIFIEWPDDFIEFFSLFNYIHFNISQSSKNGERIIEIQKHFIH
ncbi:MAG: tRNA (adenosine(37)-N6)-threonylcarbamoyltransferase complex ATPase subunit type 1 TsaE [Candidatus Muiribacteriota bacterium]